jgi:hypothetical protein
MNTTCVKCGSTEGRFWCKCGVRYCGVACQRTHWQEHKSVCKDHRKQAKMKSDLEKALKQVIDGWVDSRHNSFTHFTSDESAQHHQEAMRGDIPNIIANESCSIICVTHDILSEMVSNREDKSNILKYREWTLNLAGIPPKPVFSILINVTGSGDRTDHILKTYAPQHAEPGYLAYHYFSHDKAIHSMSRLMDVT